MATVADMTQLNAWFKTSYADKVKDLTPDNRYYSKAIEPGPADEAPGGAFSQPVTLTGEWGITKASANLLAA